MKLGIGSYTLGWATGAYGQPSASDGRSYLTANQLIDKAIDLGLSLVQICVRPELHLMTPKQIFEVAEYAAERQVSIEIGTVGSDPALLLKYLEIAGRLRAKLVRTIFPDASEGLLREREHLRTILPDYAAEGVVLAIENHERYSFLDLAELCGDLNSPFLQVCLDPVNSLGAGEGVREVVHTLLPFTAALHIKDFAVTRSSDNQIFTVTGSPMGEGRLDIPWLLETVLAANPEINVVVEQWTPFGRSWEETLRTQEQWARGAVTYLREILTQA